MLENVTYSPVLHTRAAEIRALLELPSATKDLLFSLVVASPWANANRLQMTWDKISDALEGRRFALDLDRARYGYDSAREAAREFDQLFNPAEGYLNYYELVRGIRTATPVLRVNADGVDQVERQVQHAEGIDRGIVVRLEHDFLRNPVAVLDSLFGCGSGLDVIVYIDLGWSPDILLRQAWASSIIDHVIRIGDKDGVGQVEIVVSGSSFPEMFVKYGARGEIPINERFLYSGVARRYNRRLVYGDWASTRPRRVSSPMIPKRRLDLPLPSQWICFREDGEPESFEEIANRVVTDSNWPDELNIWGTYAIQSTASQLPGAIRSFQVAAAVRINIHMHRQAFFDEPQIISDGDEPYIDD